MGSDAPNAVLLQKNHCSQTQKRPKTLEETLEKRSKNARETLEVPASAPSRCTQPKMMVVWPTRDGLGGVLAQAWVCLPGVPKGKR